jgi:hypothetical protein
LGFLLFLICNQDEIEIPIQFVSRWTSELEVQNYGWIKDPAGSYVRIDTNMILSNNVISGGKRISRRCGFIAPQRVILCYQVEDNQFNMRIVDEHGEDIPYYGTHYPTNHHAMKVVDPNYVPPIEFLSLMEPPSSNDGQVSTAMPYELFKDNLQGVEEVEIFEINDEPVYVDGEDGQPEEYLWTMKATQNIVNGISVMVRFLLINIVL